MIETKIDHITEARNALSANSGLGFTDVEVMPLLAEAQAHATLAVAEQQRIANLIAYVVKLSSHTTDISNMHPDDVAAFQSMSAQIREGLGL